MTRVAVALAIVVACVVVALQRCLAAYERITRWGKR